MIQNSVLTIGALDSSGAFGVNADTLVFNTLGLRTLCAVTIVSASNEDGIFRYHTVPPRMIEAQIDTAVKQANISACKVSALGTGAIAEAVEKRLLRRNIQPVVLGPILLAKKHWHPPNRRLKQCAARLLRLSRIAVISQLEAEALFGLGRCSEEQETCKELLQMGAQWVVLPENPENGTFRIRLAGPDGIRSLEPNEFLPCENGFFAGSPTDFALNNLLSSATAGLLALGNEPASAVEKAVDVVNSLCSGNNEKRILFRERRAWR
jgi:hydroxymethylpyrimidine/phosphomethylpyrimidine kinase